MYYLREMGATASELFAELSWERSVADGTIYQPRGRVAAGWERDEWLRDFAPIELEFRVSAGERYGAISPEEDRATCLELFSPLQFLSEFKQIISSYNDSDFVEVFGAFEDADQKQPGRAFAEWVEVEVSRKPSNLEPLLKLAWIEWFQLPFVRFARPFEEDWKWRYENGNQSGLTNLQVIAQRVNAAEDVLHPATKRVWEAMREAHTFLQENY